MFFRKEDRKALKSLKEEVQKLWDAVKKAPDKDKTEKRLEEVEKRIENVASEIVANNEVLRLQVERDLEAFKNKITDKYMQSIERLFDFMKEMAVIVVASGSNKDIISLKREFMKPYLLEKVEQVKQEEGLKVEENIKSLGKQLLDKRQKIEDEKMSKGRREESTSIEDAQLELLDFIIKGGKSA